MTSGGEPGFGTVTFPRFLHGAGGRLKAVYFGAMGTWTVIHGLPLVIGLIISRLISRADTAPGSAVVWWLLGLSVGLMLLRAAVLWGGLKLTFTLTFQVSSWIKVELLDRLLRESRARGPARSDGDILNRLREDTDEIGGLLEWTTDLIYRSVLVVVAVGILASSDLILTLPLVLLLGGLWASVFLKRRVAVLQEETRIRQGRIAATITDLLAGIRDLRLSGTVTGRVQELERRFSERRAAQVRHQIYSDLLSNLFSNVVTVGTAAVLLTVSVRAADGEFSIGKLVLFLTYIAWLGEQMFFFGYILARYQAGKVSYARLSELVVNDSPRPRSAGTVEPLMELAVTGLTCGPRPGWGAPQPITFTVRPGQLVAIKGEIGSGKSTLVRSLLALQPDVIGSVRWNGAEVSDAEARFRSPLVSYARQSPRFVRGTVRDNLVLGARDVTPEQIDKAIAAVHLSSGAIELPRGLDTELDSGEASQLSGGQRQRLALARMLCRPAQVYVVDDCDSSIDGPTARVIWQTLPTEWPGAWIVVSRNPDLLAAADVVVTVERRVGQPGPSPCPDDGHHPC